MDKKKILVVDDEIDFLQLLQLRLEANNYNVVTAMNAKDALDKFKAEKPDAVLLDILMPGTDGLNVLKKIRSENTKIPVFIITSFSNEERFKVASEFNASGFILKTNELQNEIQNITKSLEIADKYKK